VKNRYGTAAFAMENCLQGLKIAKFPVKFPDNREYLVETGSYLTVHTTIQSFRTLETVVGRKDAVSAGILSPIFNVPGLWRH
jgi:hypothetical protein